MPRLNRSTDFAAQARKPLPGSSRPSLVAASARIATGSRKRISVSVIVRCSKPISKAAIAGKHLTRSQFKSAHGSDPAAVKAVTSFAQQFNLTAASDVARRTVTLTGTVADMQRAFGVDLHQHTEGAVTYRIRQGEILLPESLFRT